MTTPTPTYRLAIFAIHPVQYHAGIYREIAKLSDVDTTVFYEDRTGLEPMYVKEFLTTIQWDVDLLGGHHHVFLRNYARNSEGGFLARINPGVIKTIRQGRFDAVLLQGYCKLTDWLVFATAKWFGIPVLFRGEATLRAGTPRSPWRARIKRTFLTRFLQRCDGILCTCTGNREYYAHYGVPDSKMTLFPCAVDNGFFQQEGRKYAGEQAAIRESLGIALDDFVIVFAARMLRLKRAHDLIEAVSRIDNKDVVLLFVGDGPAKEDAENLCHARQVRAVFTGFMNQGQISKYYAIGDLFAMLSERDRSPKAMNEAMNFSMPVICTKVTGTAPDLVRAGENGFLVETGDIDAIAAAIDTMNRNREKAREMGECSRQIVSEWSFEADAQAVHDAVERIVRSPVKKADIQEQRGA